MDSRRPPLTQDCIVFIIMWSILAETLNYVTIWFFGWDFVVSLSSFGMVAIFCVRTAAPRAMMSLAVHGAISDEERVWLPRFGNWQGCPSHVASPKTKNLDSFRTVLLLARVRCICVCIFVWQLACSAPVMWLPRAIVCIFRTVLLLARVRNFCVCIFFWQSSLGLVLRT